MSASPVVIKVGGSLYDWPELAPRLGAWLQPFLRSSTSLLVVPGGGATADVVRRLDRVHGLGEEASHWLALQSLTLNAHFLAALLPQAAVVMLNDLDCLGRQAVVPILDMFGFAQEDHRRRGCLPHTWAVTSDSLALRVADVVGARQLVLLKSVAIPAGLDWTQASQCGFVDAYFAEALRRRTAEFDVRAVNLREERPGVAAGI
jgi:aspartokinase-like uncharacterized kinase